MPRSLKDQPESLRPYLFHGVDLTWSDGDKDATAECPMCGDDRGKFGVKIDTGVYNCFHCGAKGNGVEFLRRLWLSSDDVTTSYADLASDRGLANPDTLLHWQAVRSIFGGGWMIPGFDREGKLQQLYKCASVQDKLRLLPTPTMKHYLHGVNLYDPDKPTVFLCEGPWDAMVLWEMLGLAKPSEQGDEGTDTGTAPLSMTASERSSLRAEDNVLAVPGCNVFSKNWLPLFAGKVVCLMYDSDHLHKHPKTGRQIAPAGLTGMQRVAGILSEAEHPPKEINYLKWGVDGYDPALPSGYDVRDCLTASVGGLEHRLTALEGVLGKVVPVPDAWLRGRPRASAGGQPERGGKPELECLPCDSYKTLILAWRKALKWTDGLDHALAAMLASVASVKCVGDQLWLKIIGPASCGKSVLCEAISVNHRYILAKSTIRGFHSGFKVGPGGDAEDNSLVAQLYDKTLITKDGDTLLQSPNLSQILAEARDLYDCTSRTHYRNTMSKSYSGVRMTWLLCGTSSLRLIDQSELGERFLDVVIMGKIDTKLEDEILWRVANRADRNVSTETDGKPESQYEPELALAMRLTGGYVDYLRENATAVLAATETPEWAMRRCTRLGKFVAYMRARPSYRQEETAEREFAARLVSQLVRLAKCLALVLNRDSVDGRVMERVGRVSLDTARGQTLAIVGHLHATGEKGSTLAGVALQVNQSDDKARHLLRFLVKIGVVRIIVKRTGKGTASGTKRWTLTEELKGLYRDVMGVE